MRVISPAHLRASISFQAAIYRTLQNLAKQKKVSLAWIVREAAENYIAEATIEGNGKPGNSPR